jgi:transcription elongation factor GreB
MSDKPKNYITTKGYAKLREELHNLVTKERPQYVKLVNWAASNGDRSENADYQYGKRKLREIDRRIYQLTKKIEAAEVIDPVIHRSQETIYFGATVTILRNEHEQTVKIVGQDEIEPSLNHISWTSPLARQLLRKNLGDSFTLATPQGHEEIEIVDISYDE